MQQIAIESASNHMSGQVFLGNIVLQEIWPGRGFSLKWVKGYIIGHSVLTFSTKQTTIGRCDSIYQVACSQVLYIVQLYTCRRYRQVEKDGWSANRGYSPPKPHTSIISLPWGSKYIEIRVMTEMPENTNTEDGNARMTYRIYSKINLKNWAGIMEQKII